MIRRTFDIKGSPRLVMVLEDDTILEVWSGQARINLGSFPVMHFCAPEPCSSWNIRWHQHFEGHDFPRWEGVVTRRTFVFPVTGQTPGEALLSALECLAVESHKT